MSEASKTVRGIAVNLVADVWHGMYADQALRRAFRKHTLKAEDRALLTELVQGTVRWRGQLDWILQRLFRGDFRRSPTKLKSILEVGLYQLRFLEKIPDYAAVDETVRIARSEGGERWARLVNAVLRTYLRQGEALELPSADPDPVQGLAVRYSHPPWLIRRWLERFGLEATEALCDYNNQRPEVAIRVNLARTTPERLGRSLAAEGVDARPSSYFEDFLRISHPQNLTELAAFKAGWFAIQDESTAMASLLLAPQPGETVIDLCAAPGGKTLHLAQLMGDTGRLLAVDVQADRLALLEENVHRLELSSVTPLVVDGTRFCSEPVDRILLDVPCSGLGVLARRADLRWRRREKDIQNISRLQRALLENAGRLLKPGGVLVYSTCTLEPEENECVIEAFLKDAKNFEVDVSEVPEPLTPFAEPGGSFRTLPHHHRMDGAFAVRLIKKQGKS